MEVTKTTMAKLLNGQKHYVVPIFQRIYSWKISNCRQFFNDIKKLIISENKNKDHFIGSIVEIAHKKNSGSLSVNLIIDGQQRFTTCILFIIALMDNFKDDDEVNLDKIKEFYLINRHEDNDEKYKLLLIEEDMNILKKLIDNIKINNEEESNLIKNFNFFKEQISENNYSFSEYIDTMDKLKIALITLDPTTDDSQLIFESINSTGLSLSQGDLIKNFILMDLPPNEQKNIFEKYWKEMENKLIKLNKLDIFFKHFLTIKNNRIPNEKDIYNQFKLFKNNSSDSKYEIVEEIYKFFIIFEKVIKNDFQDPQIFKSMKNLNLLKNASIIPLLMKLFDKVDENLLNFSDLDYLIKIFTSYIIRRSFAGLASSILNKVFLNLMNKLEHENIKEIICATLLNFENTQKFPNNKDFETNFKEKNIYNMWIKNPVLEMIENFEKKKDIELENYTVEHIMPQGENMPNNWKEMLGDNWKDIFDKYVHTIGNITLTLYNSELSNKSFEKKKNMTGGFKESQLKLNRFVVNSDTWGEKEIKERADELYKECLKIFPYPDIEKDILDKYKNVKINQEYTLEEHINYNNIEVKNILDKLWKFSKYLNPNLELNIKKIYINIIENEDIIACLILNKNYIIFNFYNWEEIIDENELIVDLTNKNHWGVGDARILINEKNFIKSKSIIEQVIEKYSD